MYDVESSVKLDTKKVVLLHEHTETFTPLFCSVIDDALLKVCQPYAVSSRYEFFWERSAAEFLCKVCSSVGSTGCWSKCGAVSHFRSLKWETLTRRLCALIWADWTITDHRPNSANMKRENTSDIQVLMYTVSQKNTLFSTITLLQKRRFVLKIKRLWSRNQTCWQGKNGEGFLYPSDHGGLGSGAILVQSVVLWWKIHILQKRELLYHPCVTCGVFRKVICKVKRPQTAQLVRYCSKAHEM